MFLRTQKPVEVLKFYTEQVGCSLWLNQGVCFVLQHGNLLLGFCNRREAIIDGVYTFFYPDRSEVDRMYEKLRDLADGPPRENQYYRIYHFYAHDPEGRSIEFQSFDHELKPY